MADDKKYEYIQERMDTVVEKIHELSTSLHMYVATFESHTKQDERLSEELRRTNDILQENTASLKDHMHRTDLLETYVKSLDTRFTAMEMERIRAKAVSTWLSRKMQLTAKIGAALSAAAGIAMLVKHWLHLLVQ